MGANDGVSRNSKVGKNAQAPVDSPCVAICALGEGDICRGCYRSGDEIRRWVSMDSEQRRAVLKCAHIRGKAGNPFA